MNTYTVLLLVTIASSAALGLEVDSKAASRQVNCECQCSNIEFRDKYGKLNGNCKSADTTGALWCYVDNRFNRCSDLSTSQRFGKFWSYEACATPELGSPLCYSGGYNGGFSGSNGGFNGGYNGGFSGSNGGFNGGYNGGFSGSNGGFNGGYNGGFSGSNGGFGFNGGYRSNKKTVETKGSVQLS